MGSNAAFQGLSIFEQLLYLVIGAVLILTLFTDQINLNDMLIVALPQELSKQIEERTTHPSSLTGTCIEMQPSGDIFIFDYEALLLLE